MIIPIHADGVSKSYPGLDGDFVALSPLDLELDAGELTAVEGPSGGGKSTLLNLLGLLDRPSSGRVWIMGSRVDDLDARRAAHTRRLHVGFLFQDAGLIERMTVFDNVRLPLDYRGLPRASIMSRVLSSLEGLGLKGRAHARVETLSGGERQRVGLARLLATRPPIIICDEPTASLDDANSRLVVNHLLTAAAEGACVICASHDPIVLQAANRRLFLSRGVAKWAPPA